MTRGHWRPILWGQVRSERQRAAGRSLGGSGYYDIWAHSAANTCFYSFHRFVCIFGNKEQLSGRAVIMCVTFTISSPFFKQINSFVLITHAKSCLVFSPTRFPVSNNLKCQVSRVSEEERALSPETDHDQPSPSADVWPRWIRCLENLL